MTMLKWTDGQYMDQNRGGLTTAAMYKLSGELQKRGQILNHILLNNVDESETDLAKALDIFDTFSTLAQYVNLGQVQEAAAATKQTFIKYIGRLHGRIREEAKRGTDGNHDFSGTNVSNLQKSIANLHQFCLLYTSPSPRDQRGSRMPSSA